MSANKVRVKAGKTVVQLPNGLSADAGATFYLDDPTYAKFAVSGVLGTFVDDLSSELAPFPLGNANTFLHISPVISLASLANAGIPVSFQPGYAGTILGVSALVTTVVTTAAKLATLTWAISASATGGTSTTGGAVALTSAGATPIWSRVNGTQVTATNVFTAAQFLNLTASSVTTFIEGSVQIATIIQKS